MAVRPEGAGAQQLLLALLKRDGLAMKDLGKTLLAPTGPDIAQAIRAGHADAGIATRAVATAAGLDFMPLVTERFDILMRQRDSYRPPLQTFLDIIAQAGLRHARRRTRRPRRLDERAGALGAVNAR